MEINCIKHMAANTNTGLQYESGVGKDAREDSVSGVVAVKCNIRAGVQAASCRPDEELS